jgi:hypothetical protein
MLVFAAGLASRLNERDANSSMSGCTRHHEVGDDDLPSLP